MEWFEGHLFRGTVSSSAGQSSRRQCCMAACQSWALSERDDCHSNATLRLACQASCRAAHHWGGHLQRVCQGRTGLATTFGCGVALQDLPRASTLQPVESARGSCGEWPQVLALVKATGFELSASTNDRVTLITSQSLKTKLSLSHLAWHHSIVHWSTHQRSTVEGAQVLALVKATAPDLRSARAWRTICALIANMSLHPEAAPVALEALAAAAAPEALSTLSFIPVLEAASQLVERNSAVGPSPGSRGLWR